MSIYLELVLRFMYCGFFAVGGGLATLPFLYEIGKATGWYTTQDISNMIAISESTPGPMGVNMATYVGYTTAGIPGALLAPLGLIIPSVIVIILVSRVLERFKNSENVQAVFYGLRPASTALIAAAGMGVAKLAFLHTEEGAAFSLNVRAVILAVVIWAALKKFKKHPILYIVSAAVIGILFRF